ncbi:aspartate/glutamate racemase family protein [Telmatospirillum sp. J64-1]|uniref:aspartate/glutamate racemase family protein n=1 Tax=Telmatospirillum sp. J64-1 TaxID=2502183 RepID=UPI00115DE4DF|nr:aspartate/glutamate racemase family protein [Telmatospirillum sp. J64-1]
MMRPHFTRRLLVINPNTNPAVTGLIREAAREAAAPDVEILAVNPAQGPFSIETRQHRASAVPQVLSLIRQQSHGKIDGCILACFDDIAVAEAREMLRVPVVDLCEAGIAAALSLGKRFAVVTTFDGAVPTITRHIARFGAAGQGCVRAAGIGVAAAAAQSAETEALLLDTIARAIRDDGAEAILLGSGGLAGAAPRLARRFSIPVIDGVAAAIWKVSSSEPVFLPYR